MKKMILAIIIAAWPLFLIAQTPYAGFAMRSTSSYGAMTTTMRAPTVYEPFTTYCPSEATLASDPSYVPGRHLRKEGGDEPPTTTGSTGNQPGIATPVGDAIIPLLLFSIAFLAYKQIKKYRNKAFF